MMETKANRTYSETAVARNMVGTDRTVLSVGNKRGSSIVTATFRSHSRQPVDTGCGGCTFATPATRDVRHASEACRVLPAGGATTALKWLQELGADHVALASRVSQRGRPLKLHYRCHLHKYMQMYANICQYVQIRAKYANMCT